MKTPFFLQINPGAAAADSLAESGITEETISIWQLIVDGGWYIMVPLALAITQQAGLNPEPFMFAIMIAASASFATPLGYQTNLMVYGPGGYRFSDFLRAGVPMNLIVGVTTLSVLLLIYPLEA